MWTCKFRATSHDLAPLAPNITATCCTAANGTLFDSGAKCTLEDKTPFTACATQPAYASGVWVCEDDREMCEGQGNNSRCVDLGKNGAAAEVRVGVKKVLVAAVMLVLAGMVVA